MTEPTAKVLTLPLHSNAQIPSRDERDWATSAELLDETGLTYRQADYWCRTGLITPMEHATPGSGFLRRFTNTEVTRARTIRQLLDAGIELPTIRRVIAEVLDTGHYDVGPVRITVHHDQEATA